MRKTLCIGVLTSISVIASAGLFGVLSGADDLVAGTGEDSRVAVSAATATPTVTPVLIPPAIEIPLQEGWNCYCYRGLEKSVEAVAADISGPVQAIFRIGPGGTVERWIPDAPEASTIVSVASNDALFILMAGEGGWGQIMAGPYLSSVDLVAGWNTVCYTGAAPDLEDATAEIAGDIAIVYQLSGQSWRRFVPNRPEVSSLNAISAEIPLMILVTSEGGAQWELQR
jgi:hypothetical protein